MKKLILLALMSTFAMSEFTTGTSMKVESVDTEDKRLCKVFIKKAHSYKETMRSDKLAQATLDSYKNRVVTHCSAVALKKQPMNPFITKITLNDIDTKRTDVELCKTSIKYAHAYKNTMVKNEAAEKALDYYKKDVVTNCGTISAIAS
jgi:hypothetical protein